MEVKVILPDSAQAVRLNDVVVFPIIYFHPSTRPKETDVFQNVTCWGCYSKLAFSVTAPDMFGCKVDPKKKMSFSKKKKKKLEYNKYARKLRKIFRWRCHLCNNISFHITLAHNVNYFIHLLLFTGPVVWRKILMGTEKDHLPSRISLSESFLEKKVNLSFQANSSFKRML